MWVWAAGNAEPVFGAGALKSCQIAYWMYPHWLVAEVANRVVR